MKVHVKKDQVIEWVFITVCVLMSLALFAKAAFGRSVQTIPVASVLDDGDLSDTAVTATVDTCRGGKCAVSTTLIASATAGTSTRFTVECEESADNSTWAWMPGIQEFTISSRTNHSATVTETARYVRCTYDDPDDGTGTVDVLVSLNKDD